PDDPGLLGIAADHEAVYILEENDRQAGLIAVHDEAGGLVGAIDIDDAAVLDRSGRRLAALLLVGDDTDGDAAEPAVAADHRLAVVRLVFVERRIIEDAREDIVDIVFFVGMKHVG